jgi:hypothetical protein
MSLAYYDLVIQGLTQRLTCFVEGNIGGKPSKQATLTISAATSSKSPGPRESMVTPETNPFLVLEKEGSSLPPIVIFKIGREQGTHTQGDANFSAALECSTTVNFVNKSEAHTFFVFGMRNSQRS